MGLRPLALGTLRNLAGPAFKIAVFLSRFSSTKPSKGGWRWVFLKKAWVSRMILRSLCLVYGVYVELLRLWLWELLLSGSSLIACSAMMMFILLVLISSSVPTGGELILVVSCNGGASGWQPGCLCSVSLLICAVPDILEWCGEEAERG